MSLPRSLRLRWFLVLAGISLLVSSHTALAADPPRGVTDLVFRNATGSPVPWKEVAGKKATVVVFLSFDCPMSTGYAKPLADLASSYADRGVAVVGVSPFGDQATVAKQAREYSLGFSVYADEKLAAVNALDATTTPQVFVLDSSHEVRYRGQIDDGYRRRLVANAKVTERYLVDALEAILAGKPVAVPKTDAIGCRIVRDTGPAVKPIAGSPTFHKDVLPVLQTHCQTCHRAGAAGPFSLMSYRQAKTWAEDIVAFTKDRRMPPWKPQGGKAFVGERRLAATEIDTLAKWAAAGCPEGDPKDAPPAPTFPEGWALGEPDLILAMPEEFVLGPTGRDLFRVFVLPTGLTEDKYVVAVDVRPGNSRVVHHAVNFYDASGSARSFQARNQAAEAKTRKAADMDVGPGFTSGMLPGFQLKPADLFAKQPPFGPLSGWVPGLVPRSLPAGTGLMLPKGADFVMQLHYHRNGRVERDRTRVGLYFARGPVERPILPVIIPGQFKMEGKVGEGLGYIPAGDPQFVARGSWYILEDCTVHVVAPHLHLIGKSVKMSFTPPRGQAEVLLDIPEWDFHWQEQYVLKAPLRIKAGTRFDIEAVFDNSAANPNNPNTPPIDVRFGEATTDEMLFGFLGATKDNPKSRLPSVISQGPFRLSR